MYCTHHLPCPSRHCSLHTPPQPTRPEITIYTPPRPQYTATLLSLWFLYYCRICTVEPEPYTVATPPQHPILPSCLIIWYTMQSHAMIIWNLFSEDSRLPRSPFPNSLWGLGNVRPRRSVNSYSSKKGFRNSLYKYQCVSFCKKIFFPEFLKFQKYCYRISVFLPVAVLLPKYTCCSSVAYL
jgi:hypothetical protein